MDLFMKPSSLLHAFNIPQSFKNFESTAWTTEDAPIIIDEATIFMIISFGVSLFAMVASICSSVKTYYGEPLKLTELLSVIGLKFTRVQVALFVALALALIGVVLVVFIGLNALVSLGLLIALFVLFLSLYLAVVWTLGLVIWVLIEGFYERGTFGRAGEVIKGSEKLLGFVQSLLYTVVAMAMSVILGFEMETRISYLKTTCAGIVAVNIFCLVVLFIYVVCMVLFYECEKSSGVHGEEMGVGSRDGFVSFTPVLVDAVVP